MFSNLWNWRKYFHLQILRNCKSKFMSSPLKIAPTHCFVGFGLHLKCTSVHIQINFDTAQHQTALQSITLHQPEVMTILAIPSTFNVHRVCEVSAPSAANLMKAQLVLSIKLGYSRSGKPRMVSAHAQNAMPLLRRMAVVCT